MFLVFLRLTQQELEVVLFQQNLTIKQVKALVNEEKNLEQSQLERGDVDGSMVF